MATRAVAMSLLALSVACGKTPPGGGPGGPLYPVVFHVEGYGFDPARMQVTATYAVDGAGAVNEVIGPLPWSSSPAQDASSGSVAYIHGSLGGSCAGAVVAVSIVANDWVVQSGAFDCGAAFSLRHSF